MEENEIIIDKIICFECKNYLSDLRCLAFPDGIPEEIMNGTNQHDKIFPGQKGKRIFERGSIEDLTPQES